MRIDATPDDRDDDGRRTVMEIPRARSVDIGSNQPHLFTHDLPGVVQSPLKRKVRVVGNVGPGWTRTEGQKRDQSGLAHSLTWQHDVPPFPGDAPICRVVNRPPCVRPAINPPPPQDAVPDAHGGQVSRAHYDGQPQCVNRGMTRLSDGSSTQYVFRALLVFL